MKIVASPWHGDSPRHGDFLACFGDFAESVGVVCIAATLGGGGMGDALPCNNRTEWRHSLITIRQWQCDGGVREEVWCMAGDDELGVVLYEATDELLGVVVGGASIGTN